VHIRTSCKDQVHGVLAKLGIEVTCPDIFGAWGTQWLDELPLPQPYCWKVASLRQLISWLSSEITVLEQVTADLLAGHDGYRAVQELPGIGPVPGAVIVAEIGDITRFRHPARLCSQSGLTPRHYESDTTVIRGRITKQGSRPLRWALVEAVQRTPARSKIGSGSWPAVSSWRQAARLYSLISPFSMDFRWIRWTSRSAVPRGTSQS
jgi:transposase